MNADHWEDCEFVRTFGDHGCNCAELDEQRLGDEEDYYVDGDTEW